MLKTYTPTQAIRFANQGAAALKQMTQAVEQTRTVPSDQATTQSDFSGVIRFRRDFRRYLRGKNYV
jgi:hypothetical protein